MSTVTVAHHEGAAGVALVTINDPERRNALSPPMIAELVAAFDTLEADPGVGAVVLTGAPPAFCAGADLSHLSGGPSEQGLRAIYEGFLRVGRSPLPTVAAVNGAAVGAGMNLALCCDVRIAARRARFDTRFLQIALHPGGGHTWMLRRLLGPQGAAAMVLFGEVLDGESAATAGLVWRCVADEDLLPVSCELAGRAAGQPHQLTRRTKATLGAMSDVPTHEDAVTAELSTQLWSMTQPEFGQRISALRQQITSR